MSLKDELDYAGETREDLVARVMSAQMFGRFLLKAYHALRSYNVDFMKLPEWEDQKPLEEAHRLKAHAAQWKIVEYIQRLEHALSAAIRRKQLRLHTYTGKE